MTICSYSMNLCGALAGGLLAFTVVSTVCGAGSATGGLEAVGGGAGVRSPGPTEVVRKGSGERRMKMNAMELQPFPASVWDSLSDWSGGKAISSADTNGKVVLICTYSDWYQPAQRAWTLARKLSAAHEKDGLVLVGVFHPEGWDLKRESEALSATVANAGVAKAGEKDSALVMVAHDSKRAFRKALLSDQDPDFYVIDRAGQLRYAAIATESVDEAVKICLDETADAASEIKSKLAVDAAKVEADSKRSGAIRAEVDLKSIPELTFAEPTADAYEKTKGWPKKVQDANSRDDQENVVTSLQLPPPGSYYKNDPKFKGRAIVVYLWSPDFRPSYEKIMPAMDRLQRERGRDISVIGAMARIEDSNDRKPKDTTPPGDLIKKFIDEQGIEHSQTVYAEGMVGTVERQGDRIVPWVAVASSNGVVRWSGNPNSDGFRAAVEQVIKADPGVKARRVAEEAYIKKQKK